MKTYRVGRVEIRIGKPDDIEEVTRYLAEGLRVMPQYRPFVVSRLKAILEEWLEILRAERARQ